MNGYQLAWVTILVASLVTLAVSLIGCMSQAMSFSPKDFVQHLAGLITAFWSISTVLRVWTI